jgi:hypothetical protein
MKNGGGRTSRIRRRKLFTSSESRGGTVLILLVPVMKKGILCWLILTDTQTFSQRHISGVHREYLEYWGGSCSLLQGLFPTWVSCPAGRLFTI